MGIFIDNFRVGAFDVEVPRNRILRKGEPCGLEPQVMNVLCVLAERPDEVMDAYHRSGAHSNP